MKPISAEERISLLDRRNSFLEAVYLHHSAGWSEYRVDLNNMSAHEISVIDLFYLIDHELLTELSRSSTEYRVRLSGKGIEKLEQ